ncbi:hypothetical protein D6C92_10649 [Aureobasidium pullulans]|nr:hypothetical protein D6C92_10649 [Aureobasidium pullulans]
MTPARLGPLSRRRGANPGRGIIDPRRVSGGSSRHDVAIISERWKTVYEIRHRKNIAIYMLNGFILRSSDFRKRNNISEGPKREGHNDVFELDY